MSTSSAVATAAATEEANKSKDKVFDAASDVAREKMCERFTRSKLFLNDTEKTKRRDNIPRFQRHEIITGRVLGRGGFTVVNEIKSIKVDCDNDNNNNNKELFLLTHESTNETCSLTNLEEDEEEQKKRMEFQEKMLLANNCIRNGGDARYAIKYISADCKADTGRFIQAMTDMAGETYFLSAIEHPNILKIRAVRYGDMCDKDYFLILDRLYDTLAQRIVKWRRMQKKHCGVLSKLTGRKASYIAT